MCSIELFITLSVHTAQIAGIPHLCLTCCTTKSALLIVSLNLHMQAHVHCTKGSTINHLGGMVQILLGILGSTALFIRWLTPHWV